jgi:hypothetical protein
LKHGFQTNSAEGLGKKTAAAKNIFENEKSQPEDWLSIVISI